MSILIHLYFVLVGFQLFKFGLPKDINFLGQIHKETEWKKVQKEFDRLMQNGRWAKLEAGNETEIPYYSKVCIQEGIYFTHYHIGSNNYGVCFSAFANVGERFIWQPKAEPLLPWSPSHFCELMNGQNMLIVGDSISGEFFFAMMSSMLNRVLVGGDEYQTLREDQDDNTEARRNQQKTTCTNLCDWNKPCTGPFTIDCGSDYPSFTISFTSDHTLEGNSFPFRIKDENISLLIVNAGAHFQEDDVLLRKIRAALTASFSESPELSVIWRNTYEPHPHCKSHFRSPPSLMLTSYHLDAMNFTEPDGNGGINAAAFKWSEFSRQNDLVRSLLTAEFPAVFYLDVDSVMKYRLDSHPYDNHDKTRDCLHYCLPGPLDTWVGLLHNVLAKTTHSSRSAQTRRSDANSLLTWHDRYVHSDGLILKAKHYDMYFIMKNGARRFITDREFTKFLDSIHLTTTTYNPNNASEVMIQTIDEDEFMYEISVSGL